MNILDYILIVLIAINVYGGIRRGLIRQIAALVGIFLGLYAAFRFHPAVAGILEDRFGLKEFFSRITGSASQLFPGLPDALLMTVSLLIIFISAALVAGYVGSIVVKGMKVVKLTFIDRLAGGGLGLFKGLLIALIIVQILSLQPMTSWGKSVEHSYLAPRFSECAPQVFAEVREWIEDRLPDDKSDNL
jgi:membrane protein required for colicin V production